jgi:hypothetical protein
MHACIIGGISRSRWSERMYDVHIVGGISGACGDKGHAMSLGVQRVGRACWRRSPVRWVVPPTLGWTTRRVLVPTCSLARTCAYRSGFESAETKAMQCCGLCASFDCRLHAVRPRQCASTELCGRQSAPVLFWQSTSKGLTTYM